MACFRPIKAFYGRMLPSGKREVVFSAGYAQSFIDLKLPCGVCVGCRLERARQWAMRCRDEAALYMVNCFITLTFDPLKVGYRDKPFCCFRCRREFSGLQLHKCEFQRFMKRLRKAVSVVCDNRMIRYFMCGEYGSKFGRPHYHALLFNWDFPDRKFFKETDAGEKIYTSKVLESLWPYGFSSVGDVTFGSAAYVARYHLKKVGSVVSDNHYVSKSGELLYPEYVDMSRGSKMRGTGGIGRGWYDKYKSDVYPRDVRVIKGVDTKPAIFYDRLYEIDNPDDFKRIKLERSCGASSQKLDNTEERLRVKEIVKLSQVRSLSNGLEE